MITHRAVIAAEGQWIQSAARNYCFVQGLYDLCDVVPLLTCKGCGFASRCGEQYVEFRLL